MEREYEIKALKNAFEIVEKLSQSEGETTTSLAQDMGMPTSTVSDYLKTLEKLRYVVKIDGEYHPSFRFLKIGEARRYRNRVFQIAEAEVKQIAAKTDEWAGLLIEEHGKAVLLEMESGEQGIDFFTFPGYSLFLHTTAPGKAILAHKSEEFIEHVIEEYGLPTMTDQTITDRAELMEKLVEIRKQGYAVDYSERVQGMSCIAAPILDRKEKPHGAITVCLPTQRLENDEEYKTELVEIVLEAANQIQIRLNYS